MLKTGVCRPLLGTAVDHAPILGDGGARLKLGSIRQRKVLEELHSLLGIPVLFAVLHRLLDVLHSTACLELPLQFGRHVLLDEPQRVRLKLGDEMLQVAFELRQMLFELCSGHLELRSEG